MRLRGPELASLGFAAASLGLGRFEKVAPSLAEAYGEVDLRRGILERWGQFEGGGGSEGGGRGKGCCLFLLNPFEQSDGISFKKICPHVHLSTLASHPSNLRKL